MSGGRREKVVTASHMTRIRMNGMRYQAPDTSLEGFKVLVTFGLVEKSGPFELFAKRLEYSPVDINKLFGRP